MLPPVDYSVPFRSCAFGPERYPLPRYISVTFMFSMSIIGSGCFVSEAFEGVATRKNGTCVG